jgi:hypothetical protein
MIPTSSLIATSASGEQISEYGTGVFEGAGDWVNVLVYVVELTVVGERAKEGEAVSLGVVMEGTGDNAGGWLQPARAVPQKIKIQVAWLSLVIN